MFLKNKNINKIVFFFIFFIHFILFSATLNADTKKIILEYIDNINEFSSYFLQDDGETISEGMLYLKNNRLKIEYINPSKIIIIISKKNAMYFNQDLEEVEYFNPKNSIAQIFFDIFYNNNFFNEAIYIDKNNHLIVEKKISIDNLEYKIDIYFEKKPFIIRKIIVKESNNLMTIGISNINYNPGLKDNFFSMVNPLIN